MRVVASRWLTDPGLLVGRREFLRGSRGVCLPREAGD
jgi:hypothetical protein